MEGQACVDLGARNPRRGERERFINSDIGVTKWKQAQKFTAKAVEKLSNGLIDIHLIFHPNYFLTLKQKKSKSFCLEKKKKIRPRKRSTH